MFTLYKINLSNLFLLLSIIFLCQKAFARTPIYPPEVCGDICYGGMVPNQDCECVESKMCIALACPEGEKRDFSSCGCVPYGNPVVKPSFCYIASCYSGFEVRGTCECQAKLLPVCLMLCPEGENILPGTCDCSSRKCHIQSCVEGFTLTKNCECQRLSQFPSNCPITKCDDRYELNEKNCSCDIPMVPMCRKLCKPGLTLFPPCSCEFAPKCPIQKCRRPYRLNKKNCKCVRRKPNRCSIRSCRNGYKLNKENCECLLNPYPTCKRACGLDEQLYGPCICGPRVKCPIGRCLSRYILDERSCQCVLRNELDIEYPLR